MITISLVDLVAWLFIAACAGAIAGIRIVENLRERGLLK